MVTAGIIKVRPKHYSFPPSVLQLRGGPVIAEICIRNIGAVVFRSICFSAHTQGQPDQHLSAGRGFEEVALIPLVDGRSGRQARNSRKTDRAGARCKGIRIHFGVKKKLCMDMRTFRDDLLFLIGKL